MANATKLKPTLSLTEILSQTFKDGGIEEFLKSYCDHKRLHAYQVFIERADKMAGCVELLIKSIPVICYNKICAHFVVEKEEFRAAFVDRIGTVLGGIPEQMTEEYFAILNALFRYVNEELSYHIHGAIDFPERAAEMHDNKLKDSAGIGLYLFMDIVDHLKPKHFQLAHSSIKRIDETITRKNNPDKIVYAWGIISGELSPDEDWSAKAGTPEEPGKLYLSANKRAKEIVKPFTQ